MPLILLLIVGRGRLPSPLQNRPQGAAVTSGSESIASPESGLTVVVVVLVVVVVVVVGFSVVVVAGSIAGSVIKSANHGGVSLNSLGSRSLGDLVG